METTAKKRVKATPKYSQPANVWSLLIPNLHENDPDPMDVIRRIRNGLPGSALGKVADVYQMPKAEMYNILHISPKTAQRAQSKRLDKDKSDHLVQLVKVVKRAVDVFVKHETAMSWLKSPCFSLGDQVPIQLLDTTEGIELVMDTLGRIEYGVFA